MERIAIEIFVGLFLFILGLMIGAGVVCMCKSAGEAERRLKKKDDN